MPRPRITCYLTLGRGSNRICGMLLRHIEWPGEMSPPVRSNRGKREGLSLVHASNGRGGMGLGGKGGGRGMGFGFGVPGSRGSGMGDWGGLPEGSWWYAGFFPPSVCRLLEGLSAVDECKVILPSSLKRARAGGIVKTVGCLDIG